MIIGFIFLILTANTYTGRPPVKIDNHSIVFDRQPRLGSPVRIIYSVTPAETKEKIHVIFRNFNSIRLINGDTDFFCNAQKGVKKTFMIEVEFLSTPVSFSVDFGDNRIEIFRYLLNIKTGVFGSMKDIQMYRPLEYCFNPVKRIFEEEIYNFENNRLWKNRGIIDTIRSFEPELSDSLALVLYADIAKATFPLSINNNWIDRTKYLLSEGWKNYSEASERIKFIEDLNTNNEMIIQAKAVSDYINQKRLMQEAIKLRKERKLKWLMSWIVPAVVLSILVIILLIIRSKKQSTIVTSKLFDRIVCYAIYAFCILFALYATWPYLLRNHIHIYLEEQETVFPPELKDINLNEDTLLHFHGISTQPIINLSYAKFDSMGLPLSYSQNHIKLVSCRISSKNRLEAVFKWITGNEWIDKRKDGECVQFRVVFEYFQDSSKLGKIIGPLLIEHMNPMIDYYCERVPKRKYYLRPLKNIISENEARKKLFSALPNEERFFDIYAEVNLPMEAYSDFGHLIYLVGR